MKWQNLRMLEFDVTNYCQAKCPLCPRENPRDEDKITTLNDHHYSLESFKSVVDTLPKNITQLFFCGDYGDPMMHPQIEEMIEYSLENGINYLEVSTNGGLRKDDWYTRIGNKWGKRLNMFFAIDGINGKQNSKYRVNVNFERAWNNFVAFSKTRAVCTWQYIVFDYNYDDIPQAIQIAKDLNVELFLILNDRDIITDWNHRLLDPNKIDKVQQYINGVRNKQPEWWKV